MRPPSILFAITLAATACGFARTSLGADTKIDFDKTIAPLLANRCLSCHSGGEPKGGLDLSRKSAAFKGGDSGLAIIPGKPGQSYLWKRVAANEMPPKKPLSAKERATLKAWIAGGANWGIETIDPFRFTTDSRAGYDWWALQPVKRPPVPRDLSLRTNVARLRNPIDVFIRRKLKQKGLSPSKPASRRVLIRRLYVDLIGVPPSPEEVEAFVNDPAPNAYEQFVDRLLASPQYGERWARHWLDVARFGESQGFERDKLRTNAWRYRDWVIRAFNADMPYNKFAKLQLAGDALRPGDPRAIIATGFLVAGPWDEVGQNQQSAAMKAVVRQDELEDYVSTVGQAFLGLTVHCARCHDHKFDPIRQEEYYRLTAALGGVRHGERNIKNLRTRQQADTRKAVIQARIETLHRRIDAIDRAAGIDSRPATVARKPSRKKTDDKANERSSSELPPEILRRLPPETRELRNRLQFEIGHLKTQLSRWDELKSYAVTPKSAGKAYLLNRGNPAQKERIVTPGGVASVAGVKADFNLAADAPDDERRMKLADWITDENNPLFARVIVNRLWHYHFGRGLVSTPSDFGFNGGRPSHPELLDWLAAEFVGKSGKRKAESGVAWRLKHIHRLIVTSATYRQDSRSPKPNPQSAIPNPQSIDAGNVYLWRMTPRRLEAEAVRDAMLAVSGKLNATQYGPGYYDFTTHTRNTQFYFPIDPVGHTFNRRSLYRTWVRSGRNRFLDVFDCPDPSTKTPKRAVTITPLQALTLLNNSFVLRMSEQFAARIERETKAHRSHAVGQVRRAWQLAYGREPDREELKTAVTFVKQHGLPALCRVILNSNEFLFVD